VASSCARAVNGIFRLVQSCRAGPCDAQVRSWTRCHPPRLQVNRGTGRTRTCDWRIMCPLRPTLTLVQHLIHTLRHAVIVPAFPPSIPGVVPASAERLRDPRPRRVIPCRAPRPNMYATQDS
jgi:hypothetical protein